MSLLSVDQALEMVLGLARPPCPEDVDIQDALGRVLIRDAASRITQPPFDAAAMDGYAVRDADLPGPLRVVGEAAAGRAWNGTLGKGEALRIFTGARVVYALTAARVAGAVTQTQFFDYRVDDAGKGHFGAPLTSAEIYLKDMGSLKTTDDKSEGEVRT